MLLLCLLELALRLAPPEVLRPEVIRGDKDGIPLLPIQCHRKGRRDRRTLPVHKGRCKDKGNLQLLLDQRRCHRHAVSEKENLPSSFVQILQDLLCGDRAAGTKDRVAVPLLIDARVDLPSSGIHQGTHEHVRPEGVCRDRIRRGDADDRLVQGKADALCRCGADAKARKGARALGQSNRIDLGKVQREALCQLLHDGHQRLAVGQPILDAILPKERVILENGAACDRPGCFNCKYLHAFLLSCCFRPACLSRRSQLLFLQM